MSEIVNLRSVRKRRAREAATEVARENRVLHGQSRAEKEAAAREAARRARELDGKKTQ